MNIPIAREHLLQAKSIIICGELKGFFLDTEDYTALLKLLHKERGAGHG